MFDDFATEIQSDELGEMFSFEDMFEFMMDGDELDDVNILELDV